MRKNAFAMCSQAFGGGLAYGLLEIAWRGYTHISMLFLGGICFIALWNLSKLHCGLMLKCLFGATLITSLEFLMGCIVNLWLDLAVWDYSQEVCQLMGQVCIRYFLLWYSLCLLIIPLCQIIREKRGRFVRVWGAITNWHSLRG